MWSIWGASAEGLSLGPLLKHSHLGEEGEEDASSARQDCFLVEKRRSVAVLFQKEHILKTSGCEFPL